MLAIDFEYNDSRLSDFGFMICSFNDTGLTAVSMGSYLTFNKTSVMMGKKHLLASAVYEDCITAEFDICKQNCSGIADEFYVSQEEERELMRWLNRKQFNKFRPISEDGANQIYYNGSFNIEKIELSGEIVGLHLIFESDSPFGNEDFFRELDIPANEERIIYDMSDEIGYTYLDMMITCNASGDLEITNLFENKTTIVKNCTKDEVITFKNMIITSSIEERNATIMNDFNFIFPTISNTYKERENTFIFSLPCNVIFEYSASRKVGI